MLAFCSIVLFAQISGVQFSATVSPQTVYIGQQVSFDASMRANVLAQTSFQSPPEYTPPDIRGVTLYDFPFDTIHSVKDVAVSGLMFKQYTYHRALFPLTAGTYTVPPATLVYRFPKEDDPYASEVDSLHSAPQTFTVLPLPATGKPPNFLGAVGQFTVAMYPDSQASFAVGTAFTLHVVVTGTGNIDLLPRPNLTMPSATVVPSVENVHWDSTGTLVHGTKEFQWLVNPRQVGQMTIPAVQYSYFDPVAQKYETATTVPVTVTVAAGNGVKGGASAADTIGTTPFPTLIRAVKAHLMLVIVVVVLVLAGIIFLAIRARDPEYD